MHDFILKEIINGNINDELQKIGFDSTYTNKASEKYEYKNIKLYSLSLPQANILKQTALSVGCDCAIHREVITAKVETSDCILGGSISQLKKVSQKLKSQPFGLKKLSESLYSSLALRERAGEREQSKIAGILNLTDNSFSDGGMYNDFENAKTHLLQMIEEGADIIDIGAESTKPYSKAVNEDIQLEKILPIVEFAKNKTIISIDTRSAKVAQECIKAGAHIINDVSGLEYDEKMADVIAKYGIKVIIQHSQGTPETMQNNPQYESIMDELYLNLKEKIDFAISNGIKQENIIIDPGIGFGKTRAHNFEIIRRIEEFKGLGCPVMLGLSRKSLLNMPDEDNFTKDIYTVALNTLAIENKIDIIRVHNVKLHKQLIDVLNP